MVSCVSAAFFNSRDSGLLVVLGLCGACQNHVAGHLQDWPRRNGPCIHDRPVRLVQDALDRLSLGARGG